MYSCKVGKETCGRASWERRLRQGVEAERPRALVNEGAQWWKDQVEGETSRARHNNHGDIAGALSFHGGCGEDIDSGSSARGTSVDRDSTQ